MNAPKLPLILLVLTALFPNLSRAQPQWPQFRGVGGLSVAGEGAPPVHFSPASNVLWKAALPSGNSSPCLWGNRIFITAYIKPALEILCLDRATGKILWRHAPPVRKVEATHSLNNPATPTPATDGTNVFVYFGSVGLMAFDFEGKVRWSKPLSAPVVEFGTSTSPLLAGDLLILNFDQDEGSFLLAVEKRTGREVWRRDRGEFRRGFASPFLWRHDGAEELIVPGSLWLKSYNLAGGTERWSVSGTCRVACSSPAAGDGLLFSAGWNIGGDEGARLSMPRFDAIAPEHDQNKDGQFTLEELPKGPFRERFSQIDVNKDGIATRAEWDSMADAFAKAENALIAIRPGGRGDITRTHVAWRQTRSLPYVSSPLYYQGKVFTVKNGGLASCYEARSGKALYQDERLGPGLGDFYSSAVGANNKVYVTAQKGTVVVYEAGDSMNVLARNDLGEHVMATPAIVEGKIYLRTATALYAFGL